MSIRIIDMDMPKTCMDCRFKKKRLDEFYCTLTDALFFMDEKAGARLPWCPLEEEDKDRPSWVHILPNDGPFSDYWICGSCGWQVPGCTKPTGFTHCPHCGKQMKELNEDFKAWEEP